jgi:hypothetical protein
MLASENKTKNLLLISSSNVHGCGYLDHVEADIYETLEGVERVVFVPFALYDRDAYALKAAQRLDRMGFALDSDPPLAKSSGNDGGRTSNLHWWWQHFPLAKGLI